MRSLVWTESFMYVFYAYYENDTIMFDKIEFM